MPSAESLDTARWRYIPIKVSLQVSLARNIYKQVSGINYQQQNVMTKRNIEKMNGIFN